MKSIKIKILLILLMLVQLPFSCKDRNECLELDFEPYFSAQNMVFKWVDKYYVNKRTNSLMFEKVSQEFDYVVYSGDSMAMYFEAPDTALLFHSQLQRRFGFNFTQEAFACVARRPGWAGTRDLVDKIYISSNYDYNEAYRRDYDMSDIVDIFAYKSSGDKNWVSLRDYNENSPYEAPKRFYLLIKSKPTLSPVQQFVIKYYMKNEPGESSKYFIIETPVFHMR